MAVKAEVGERPVWQSRFGFILAAAGSAVGLGNVWRFPYVTGENGGGAFVLVYLLSIVIVGMPIMVAELVIGWRAQRNPVGAMVKLSSKRYAFIGVLGVLAGFIILSFYSVVAGWTLSYVVMAFTGKFWQVGQTEIPGLFGALYSNSTQVCIWHGLFMILTTGIVMCGVQKGIERWSKILMPSLFVIFLLLLGFAVLGGGAKEALVFLFKPDFSKLNAKVMLEAVGQSFFTLSLGMGAMMTYGSYLRRDENVVGAGATIAVIDTAIALFAGLVIFPIVFRFGQEPAAGVGLVFQNLPQLFVQMPAGRIFAIAFFLLLVFAALTSAISLLEVVVAYLVDELKIARVTATIGAASIVFALGILSAISTLKVPFTDGTNFLDFFDGLTTNYMLPIGGLLIALFAGFVMKKEDVQEAFTAHDFPKFLFPTWVFISRFVAPLLVLMVFLTKIIGE